MPTKTLPLLFLQSYILCLQIITYDQRVCPWGLRLCIGPRTHPAIRSTAQGVKSLQTAKNGKKEVMSTRAWEKILNACKSTNVIGDRQGVGYQQVESGPSPKDDDNLITTAEQDLMAEGRKSQTRWQQSQTW